MTDDQSLSQKSITLPAELVEEYDRLAARCGKPRDFLLQEACEAYAALLRAGLSLVHDDRLSREGEADSRVESSGPASAPPHGAAGKGARG